MTIRELEAALPGGFHDALLHSYAVDLVGKSARLHLELSVGDPESDDEAVREACQHADLILRGVEYFAVEAPDPRYGCGAPWRIDLCAPDASMVATPETGFSGRFYSADTNSFIHFAAEAAEIVYERPDDPHCEGLA